MTKPRHYTQQAAIRTGWFSRTCTSVGNWFRSRRHPFLWLYTILFVIAALAALGPFLVEERHFMWVIDGLRAHYVRFVTFGRWIRSILTQSLREGRPVLPNWNPCLGYGSDLAVYVGSYLGNPFNWISVVLPSRYAEWGFDASIILQLYAAGLSFGLLAQSKGNGTIPTLAGALCYVFSGWTQVCMSQYVFIYPLVIFPLLLWAAERMFEGKSPLAFILVAADFFLFYFYFAYMAFVLLVPYCVMLFFRYGKKTVTSFLGWVAKVIGAGAIGLLISSAVLIPIITELVKQDRLGIERHVPALYALEHYKKMLESTVSIVRLSADASFMLGAAGIVACVLLFSRKGNRPLKAFLVLALAISCIPAAGSALNGFQYVSDRWMWGLTLCVSYAVCVALPDLQRLDFRGFRMLALASAALVIVLVAIPARFSVEDAVGVDLLLGLILLAGALYAAPGCRLSSDAKTALLCACLIVSVAVPFHLSFTKESLNSFVEAGEALRSFSKQPAVTALKKIDDDEPWRYDTRNVDHVPNTGVMVGRRSFGIYANIYNQRIDNFVRGLELADSQLFALRANLNGRSYLEAALGARYFVVGNKGGKPNTADLPYGVGQEPVASSGSKAFVFRNELALPLAYTFSDAIGQDEFESHNAIQQQQLLLQAVALKGDSSEGLVSHDFKPSFSEREIAYSIEKTHAVDVGDGVLEVTAKDGTVSITLDEPATGEVYVELVNLQYENHRPKVPEELTLSTAKDYLREICAWKPATEFKVKLSVDKEQRHLMGYWTSYSHMYAGDDTNLVNLGYTEDGIDSFTLGFSSPGTYTFDAIRVISQPMDQLEGLVGERRTYPVNLVEGVNSYTADVTVDDPQVLFFSVPWSTGWSATVDGKAAQVFLADGAFMAVDLGGAGSHHVELTYETPGLRLGVALSCVGVALAVGVHMVWRRRTDRRVA